MLHVHLQTTAKKTTVKKTDRRERAAKPKVKGARASIRLLLPKVHNVEKCMTTFKHCALTPTV